MHMSAVMRKLLCAAIAFSVRPLLLKETGGLLCLWPFLRSLASRVECESSALSLSFCFQSSLSSLVCSWTLTSKKRSGECTQGTFSQLDHWNYVCRIRTWSVFTVCTVKTVVRIHFTLLWGSLTLTPNVRNCIAHQSQCYQKWVLSRKLRSSTIGISSGGR